jgi:hypothetical protein
MVEDENVFNSPVSILFGIENLVYMKNSSVIPTALEPQILTK